MENRQTKNGIESNNTNIVRRVLNNEVKIVIGIVVVLVGVISPYYQIKEDIAIIKQNHFSHMETMQKDILKLQEQQEKDNEKFLKLMEAMAKLQK